MPRRKGGRVSLTAFEAEWLTMVADMAADEAIDALEHLSKPPRRVKDEPYEAWQRIVDKIIAASNDA